MIQEIMAHLKEEGREGTFWLDSGYFDEDILETIETGENSYELSHNPPNFSPV